jgi:hypothetical protein
MFLSLSMCNGVQQHCDDRWYSCHCLRVMVSNNSFVSDDVPVIVYVQWCPTTISCQMMFLSLSTCNGVQKQFHVRWCSCHCQRLMVSNNSFMSDDVPVIVYVQWLPTTVSCQMMFLSLSTCNGVQQQFHVRWCSCHFLRVMVSNNSFMSDDVPVIIYVQWCPTTISCQIMFLSFVYV